MSSLAGFPWNVPVHVRPEPSFLALRPEHQPFAVVTDLSSSGGFAGAVEHVAADAVAYADLQTCVDGNAIGRLGSGRSIFYRDHYLKGVGRTPLAANWTDLDDVYHHSGHLFASGAAREFIASRVLEHLGHEDTIVDCEGVLVRPLDSRLQGILAQSLPERYDRIQQRAADESLQAISVKRGRFARFSNLVWLWNSMSAEPGESFVITAARITYHALIGFRQRVADAEITAATIVGALESAAHTFVDNCMTFIDAGVYWGSFHNNFTADGRFLDIELPTFTGGNFLGMGMVRDEAPPPVREATAGAVNVGTEVFSGIRQIRLFLHYWENRLRWLAAWGRALDTSERQFCLQLADGLAETFTAESLVHNEDRVLNRVLEQFCRRLPVGPSQRHALVQLLREAYAASFHFEQPRTSWDFVRLPVDLPDSEPGVRIDLYYPAFLRGAMTSPLKDLQQEVGALLQRIDGESSPERWLDLLKTLQRPSTPTDRPSDGRHGDRLP